MERDAITIPRREHERLRRIERSFEELQNVFFSTAFVTPSTKDATTILREMKATKTYKPAFLKSLARGLKESSYFSR